MGYGKTAIAQSICRALEQNSFARLAASFFVCPMNAISRNPFAIIRTIAYRLALHLPDMRSRICVNLRAEPSPLIGSLEVHIEQLITCPLRNKVRLPKPIVIVLDGINHCSCVQGANGRLLFEKLCHAILQLELPIKLLVSGFNDPPLPDHDHEGLALSSIPLQAVKDDIERYLWARLQAIHDTNKYLPSD
jgi:hypothetical protein